MILYDGLSPSHVTSDGAHRLKRCVQQIIILWISNFSSVFIYMCYDFTAMRMIRRLITTTNRTEIMITFRLF